MDVRIDSLLVQQGLATGREKAKDLIQNEQVVVNGKTISKASVKVSEEAEITIVGDVLPYVSRGGLKLEKALQQFPITLENTVCMDVGASTGGFTDCMLQNGAQKVYAVDVGTNQLHETLRQDPRVVVMEHTNIRYLQADDMPELVDFISIDVSFISLTLVLPAVKQLLKIEGELVCLIKPQFEAGPKQVGKKGVVKNFKVHRQVLENICQFAEALGFSLLGLEYSPIKGPEGNIEYLLYIKNTEKPSQLSHEHIINTLQHSHNNL